MALQEPCGRCPVLVRGAGLPALHLWLGEGLETRALRGKEAASAAYGENPPGNLGRAEHWEKPSPGTPDSCLIVVGFSAGPRGRRAPSTGKLQPGRDQRGRVMGNQQSRLLARVPLPCPLPGAGPEALSVVCNERFEQASEERAAPAPKPLLPGTEGWVLTTPQPTPSPSQVALVAPQHTVVGTARRRHLPPRHPPEAAWLSGNGSHHPGVCGQAPRGCRWLSGLLCVLVGRRERKGGETGPMALCTRRR